MPLIGAKQRPRPGPRRGALQLGERKDPARAQGGPYTELPLWVPRGEGFGRLNNRKALTAGLTCRPLAETVQDTLAWEAPGPPDETRKNWLSQAREAEVLAAWHAIPAA